MASAILMLISSFFLFSFLGVECSVPVLIWGSDNLSLLPLPFIGHTVSSDAFQKSYLENLVPCPKCEAKTLVIFMQDKLSIDDFTHYADVFDETSKGGAFENVKLFMEELPSLTLSSVQLPENTIEQLKKHFSNIIEVNAPSELDTLEPSSGDNLIIVNLPDSRSRAGSVHNNLMKNDKYIGAILTHLKSKKIPYTAVYTAKEASKKPAEDIVIAHGRQLRAVEETAANGTAVLLDNCTLLYYTEIVLRVTDKQKATHEVTLKAGPNVTGSGCSNSTTNNTLELVWSDAGNISTVSIKFDFQLLKSGFWEVKQLLLNYSGGSAGLADEVEMDGSSFQSWIGYSYHCTKTGPIKMMNMTLTPSAVLYFKDFQVQPFALKDNKFGYPNDCSTFFTIPIFAGLATALILIAILTFGLYMVSMINTMDRFDDPKGQTITIHADEK